MSSATAPGHKMIVVCILRDPGVVPDGSASTNQSGFGLGPSGSALLAPRGGGRPENRILHEKLRPGVVLKHLFKVCQLFSTLGTPLGTEAL